MYDYNNYCVFLEPKPLIDVSDLYNERCLGAPAITSIIDNFSPYLYPFAVEFNILIGEYISSTILSIISYLT